MFKEHPKGLYVAFFTNMGERFGYYTMLAIVVLFLQAKYGMDAAAAGGVYATFLFFAYFFPLLGGFLADRYLGYGRAISIGLIVMFLGYFMLTLPTNSGTGFSMVVAAMGVIALGTGFFKGNLQALVGNLYDDPRYSPIRDRAYNIFYMGINIGAMFAPTAANFVSNWILDRYHFTYDQRIPAMANQFMKGRLADTASFLEIARSQNPTVTMETLRSFSESYINALSKSYHYAFGCACVSLIASMIVFRLFRKYYRDADMTEKQKSKSDAHKGRIVELTPQQTRERMLALILVFIVVIFFWMSFQQNGLTMTYFARDYTVPSVGRWTNLWFDLVALLAIFMTVVCVMLSIRAKNSRAVRLMTGIGAVVFAFFAWFRFHGYEAITRFTPQMFQQFNPFFIVALTPLLVGFLAYLNRRGKEPSAPRKIGFGMLMSAISFGILIVGSIGLPSPKALAGQVAPANVLISPYWLIVTYFLLTIAELLLSPMGISFVSKVAPPKYKGLMQGGWFAATAIGNYLVSVIGLMWDRIPLWSLWSVLAICCLLSAAFMFIIVKRLEKTTNSI